MRQGLSAWRATGAEHALSNMLALLADAYRKSGQVEEGLNVLAEALVAVQKTGERWWEAALFRLKGELLLTHFPENQAEAESSLWEALNAARRQQAKALELQTAISLSRLWQRQGKQQAAHQLLAEIYSRFTEGFDTADLQEAKALRDELA